MKIENVAESEVFSEYIQSEIQEGFLVQCESPKVRIMLTTVVDYISLSKVFEFQENDILINPQRNLQQL